MTYAELRGHADAGRLVAIAPAVDEDGDPALVVVTGDLPPLHLMHLDCATRVKRARIAIRAVKQVRQHYGID